MHSSDSRQPKKLIYYTRDYRHFPKASPVALLYFLLTAVPALALIFFFYPEITLWISEWVRGVLVQVLDTEISITSSSYIPFVGPIYFIDIAGRSPSFLFALISLIASVLLLFLLPQFDSNRRSVTIYLCMGLFVHALSSAFFVFFPEYFPYTLTDYSELYMKQQISLWLTITLIIGLTTAIVPGRLLSKLAAFFATLLYSGLYGITRCVVYFYVLVVGSSLFMSTLFFTLGVLFDFIQLVMVYSVFIKGVSQRIDTRKGRELWEWS